jgi:AcrR family transcriptional regulator
VAATRRIGSTDSETRTRLVDAAEALLLEEGYAAVTSRRVGARADLKPQLVHYYFRTMDDLFLEVFRRRADDNLDRMARAVAADGSLAALWRLNRDPRGAAFMVEFMALAHHRPAVRDEVARYAERFRAAQVDAVQVALDRQGVAADVLPAEVAQVAMTALAQVMALEGGLGVTDGHAATVAFVETLIARLET